MDMSSLPLEEKISTDNIAFYRTNKDNFVQKVTEAQERLCRKMAAMSIEFGMEQLTLVNLIKRINNLEQTQMVPDEEREMLYNFQPHVRKVSDELADLAQNYNITELRSRDMDPNTKTTLESNIGRVIVELTKLYSSVKCSRITDKPAKARNNANSIIRKLDVFYDKINLINHTLNRYENLLTQIKVFEEKKVNERFYNLFVGEVEKSGRVEECPFMVCIPNKEKEEKLTDEEFTEMMSTTIPNLKKIPGRIIFLSDIDEQMRSMKLEDVLLEQEPQEKGTKFYHTFI
jgi:hypothetical protein